MQFAFIPLILLLLTACRQDTNTTDSGSTPAFSPPVRVSLTGYNGNSMEPFITPDGNTLLFNNLNAAPENTNLHWATKINDSSFQYQGEITGINTADLEGVPSADNAGHLYFVSTRNYAGTLSTIYQCTYSAGAVSDVQLVNGISLLQPGWLNFDAEISADGQTLYFVDGQFDNSGVPFRADLVIAVKNTGGFQRLTGSSQLLQNINTTALEYAPCLSANQLTLYFTRLKLPVTVSSFPEIYVASRNNITEPFSTPSLLRTITGFAEAATLAPDQKTLYYHKKENDKFVLYFVKRL